MPRKRQLAAPSGATILGYTERLAEHVGDDAVCGDFLRRRGRSR